MNVHIGIFKGYAVLDRDVNIVEYLLAQLPTDGNLQKAAIEKLKDIDPDNNKQFTMVNIRNILFSTYLNWKWPDIEYDFILRRVEHGLKDVPIGLKTLQLTLEIVLDIGYDVEKVQYVYIIVGHLSNYSINIYYYYLRFSRTPSC